MVVYPLILSEVFTSLSLLSERGVAVIKMFTMYEVHTIALMYVLNLLFEKVCFKWFLNLRLPNTYYNNLTIFIIFIYV